VKWIVLCASLTPLFLTHSSDSGDKVITGQARSAF